ncbi:competence type IV pilus minor pilin ComGG [Enterococcus sp.]|uniref:competence type IV pilus minor pilin ComGG n=1 Tax=Enterococcus sp. TaxID=35783 RepID=UPI00289ED3B4|nr:competence type IV pilus minor pilin ComGG [Enterococcus sp.]
MGNGRSIRYKGGILLTALLLIQLLSLMLITVLESSRTTTDFYHKTIQRYEASIMSELFWAEYQSVLYPKSGTRRFNTGELTYESRGEQVVITCRVGTRTFTFHYAQPPETPEIDTDEETD